MNKHSVRKWLVALGLFTGLSMQNSAVAQTASPGTVNGSDEGDPITLEKVEVTGSRIKRVEAEGPSPIKIITRQDIETTGRSNLTELLREIPEASAIGINEGGTVSSVRGATALDLRQLGANNTLVIVDGRRVVLTGANSGGTTFVDLNRFPISMIERIEILKDGASAIYGADATAGVVNIITRKDYNGFELITSYGNAFDTDVAEKSFSLFGGAASGKASATVAVSYFRRNALAASDKDFSSNADLTERYAAKGGDYVDDAYLGGWFDLRSGTGNQARVNAPAGSFLPGTNGRAPITASNPLGQLSGLTPSFTNPYQLGTGGVFNQAAINTYEPQRLSPGQNPSNLFNFQPFVWLVPATERLGFASNFKYDFTPNVQGYFGVTYQHNESEIRLAPSPISTAGDNGIVVPATNYWNPFGIAVNFNYRPTEVGPRIAEITSNTYQFLGGVRGRLLDKFDWDVGYTYGRDESNDVTKNAVSESRLRAALARTDAKAFNIFGGPNFRNNPETIESIKVTTQKGGSADLTLLDAKISGTVFELPTGDLGMAIYSEYREEKFVEANDAISTTLDDIIGQVRLSDATSAYRNVRSAAAELNVPLVRRGNVRFVYDLSITAAARFEKFSDGYDSGVKPYVGLRFQPFKSLLLRGSYTESFRAPSLPQLFGGVRESLVSALPDYARPQALTGDPFDGSSTQRLVRAGGNASLKPEQAKSFQFGLVYDFTVKPLVGLSVEATWGQIEQSNIITTTGTAFLRSNEFGDAAGLITREAGTETYTNNTANPITVYKGPGARGSAGADVVVNPGQSITVPGRILSLSDSYVNLAYQRVRYFDFSVKYHKRTVNYGRFVGTVNGTYMQEYTFTRNLGSPLTNYRGRDGYPGFRTQARVDWSLRNLGAGVSHNYLPAYGSYDLDGYEVDAYQTANAYFSYEIPAGRLFGGIKLTIGIDNVLNEKPPLYYDGVGYDQSLIGRPQGRFGYISLKREF